MGDTIDDVRHVAKVSDGEHGSDQLALLPVLVTVCRHQPRTNEHLCVPDSRTYSECCIDRGRCDTETHVAGSTFLGKCSASLMRMLCSALGSAT